MMVEGLGQIRGMIKETEEKIEDLCKEFPEYRYLLTIPGFGPDMSAKVLGAIGEPNYGVRLGITLFRKKIL